MKPSTKVRFAFFVKARDLSAVLAFLIVMLENEIPAEDLGGGDA